jgi:hypothetical protein
MTDTHTEVDGYIVGSIREARRVWTRYREALAEYPARYAEYEQQLAAWKRRRAAAERHAEEAERALTTYYNAPEVGLGEVQTHAFLSIAWSLRDLVERQRQDSPYRPSEPDECLDPDAIDLDDEWAHESVRFFGIRESDPQAAVAQFRAALAASKREDVR